MHTHWNDTVFVTCKLVNIWTATFIYVRTCLCRLIKIHYELFVQLMKIIPVDTRHHRTSDNNDNTNTDTDTDTHKHTRHTFMHILMEQHFTLTILTVENVLSCIGSVGVSVEVKLFLCKKHNLNAWNTYARTINICVCNKMIILHVSLIQPYTLHHV